LVPIAQADPNSCQYRCTAWIWNHPQTFISHGLSRMLQDLS
jgi:hypothetical protein